MEIEYRFIFEDKSEKKFKIALNPETNAIIPFNDSSEADWTRLTNCQCKNCQLDPQNEEFCPISVNINNLVIFFKNFASFEKSDVIVTVEERTYKKHSSIQESVGSLLGIFMAASGCPTLERLKPMARFHLPFASIEETVFRSISSYLLGQHFRDQKGMSADLELKKLGDFYDEIQVVNHHIAERLRGIKSKDAVKNAVICLDIYAKELSCSFDTCMENLQNIYDIYLKK